MSPRLSVRAYPNNAGLPLSRQTTFPARAKPTPPDNRLATARAIRIGSQWREKCFATSVPNNTCNEWSP